MLLFAYWMSLQAIPQYLTNPSSILTKESSQRIQQWC